MIFKITQSFCIYYSQKEKCNQDVSIFNRLWSFSVTQRNTRSRCTIITSRKYATSVCIWRPMKNTWSGKYAHPWKEMTWSRVCSVSQSMRYTLQYSFMILENFAVIVSLNHPPALICSRRGRQQSWISWRRIWMPWRRSASCSSDRPQVLRLWQRFHLSSQSSFRAWAKCTPCLPFIWTSKSFPSL